MFLPLFDQFEHVLHHLFVGLYRLLDANQEVDNFKRGNVSIFLLFNKLPKRHMEHLEMLGEGFKVLNLLFG